MANLVYVRMAGSEVRVIYPRTPGATRLTAGKSRDRPRISQRCNRSAVPGRIFRRNRSASGRRADSSEHSSHRLEVEFPQHPNQAIGFVSGEFDFWRKPLPMRSTTESNRIPCPAERKHRLSSITCPNPAPSPPSRIHPKFTTFHLGRIGGAFLQRPRRPFA